MSDFVYQDVEIESDIAHMDVDGEGIPTVPNNPLLNKPFNKQLVARTDEFWQLIGTASERPTHISSDVFDRLRQLRDGLEQRDVVYSIMLLGSDDVPMRDAITKTESDLASGGSSHSNSPHRLILEQERRQAERLLESEARGKATNAVFQNVAAMALRAFV